eukprot:1176780-Prorocentrum_minimum.AAC.2
MSERVFNATYKIASSSNGKTLDVNSAKGSGNVEYKIDKNLKIKASFTEDVLTKASVFQFHSSACSWSEFQYAQITVKHRL